MTRALVMILLQVLLAAGCDSSEVAPARTLQEAAHVLAHESGSVVRDYSTRDFGREQFAGARSVVVPGNRAQEILAAVRSRLGPGLIAFIGTQNNLADSAPIGIEVVVASGESQFDILRVAASDAVNYDMGTEDLVRELQTWDAEVGIDIYAAQTDLMQLRLKTMPRDLKRFAGRVYEFCPDIVDQGTGTVAELEKTIAESREIYLWWD